MNDNISKVFAYIDERSESFVSRLKEFLTQPCVVARGEGVQESARLVVGALASLGYAPELLSSGSSPPAVFSRIAGSSSLSLLFYNHYDVQPEDPVDEWTSPPFRPEVRDGRVFARGVADNRGDFLARVFAVEAVLATAGRLPIEVKFFCEGEEEVGSPHLAQIVSQNAAKLKSDGCLWESSSRSSTGRIQLFLGLKGMCAVQISVTGPRTDLHSSNATLVQNPAWRLISALASLRDLSGRVLIPGFYDDVRPPTPEELALAREIPFGEDEIKAKWGVDAFIGGVTGTDALHRHLFDPTCNICGLSAGYQGPGVKTVLPRLASAKLDFRLVPHQNPERVFELLKRHLDRSGFPDADVTLQGGLLPARTSPDAPASRAAISAAKSIYPKEPIVFPSMAASGPMSLFTDDLATPTVAAGVGNDRSNIHGPNENILVEDLILGVKYVVALMYEMARLNPGLHSGTAKGEQT